ncbi:MAG: (d)CMP kinase [Verrucomicrobiae bacterium]|nr:(d)CMP kinase [Verrucomicrobiae bacterium]
MTTASHNESAVGGTAEARHRVIAIDGPAASGKSTVARRVAESLGFLYVNSGAMYRAITWQALDQGADCSDRDAVLALLESTEFTCEESDGAGVIGLNGAVAGDEVHGAEVNANVSRIAAYPEVRDRIFEVLQAFPKKADVVMEGRDIGSVVFPDTPYKFYIDASPEIREARRRAQGLEDSIADRDRQDSTRKAAPLMIADDAEVIDSSHLGVDDVVTAVRERLAAKGVDEAKSV